MSSAAQRGVGHSHTSPRRNAFASRQSSMRQRLDPGPKRKCARTGTLSAPRSAQIALPTKPPASITTTRLGARRMEVECSSIGNFGLPPAPARGTLLMPPQEDFGARYNSLPAGTMTTLSRANITLAKWRPLLCSDNGAARHIQWIYGRCLRDCKLVLMSATAASRPHKLHHHLQRQRLWFACVRQWRIGRGTQN
jgi:hypothetical protein